jgi:hypothetical protein
MDSIRLNSSAYVELEEYKDELTDITIENATVTAKIYDEDTGLQVGPTITMPHVSNGTYRQSIAYDHSGLFAGMKCRIDIFADAGTGKRMTKKLKVSIISDS